MPSTFEQFRPVFWLRNAHIQTILAHFLTPTKHIKYKRELLAVEGDSLELFHYGYEQRSSPSSPSVLLLHGLQGCFKSHYILRAVTALRNAGFCVTVMHYRNCGFRPNATTESYHAGKTDDILAVVQHLLSRFTPSLHLIGYSLGGNMLINLLAQNPTLDIQKAVAVSPVFELAKTANKLQKSLFGFYDKYLLRLLIKSHCKKCKRVTFSKGIPNEREAKHIKTIEEFDNKITAPIHGFFGKDDYYKKTSSRQFLSQVKHSTLLLHSYDDPFIDKQAIPSHAELAPNTRMQIAKYGGHIGYLDKDFFGSKTTILERTILEFLRE